MQQLQQKLRNFWKRDEGNATIEAIIWIPIFVTILAIMVNFSLILFTQTQMLKVTQNANRAYSTGSLMTIAALESYVSTELAHISDMTVETAESGGIITTTVTAPFSSLAPLSIPGVSVAGRDVVVASQHYVEY
jgi:Flp pilus assembly protein TadG